MGCPSLVTSALSILPECSSGGGAASITAGLYTELTCSLPFHVCETGRTFRAGRRPGRGTWVLILLIDVTAVNLTK